MMPRKKDKAGTYGTGVGADTAKTLLYRRYKILKPGPGYHHWPVEGPTDERPDPFDAEYFKQLTAEEYLPRYRAGVLEHIWDAKKRRNEATDCSVYSMAAIRIAQQNFGIQLKSDMITEEPKPKKAKRGGYLSPGGRLKGRGYLGR